MAEIAPMTAERRAEIARAHQQGKQLDCIYNQVGGSCAICDCLREIERLEAIVAKHDHACGGVTDGTD
jgi:hypothetical protein